MSRVFSVCCDDLQGNTLPEIFCLTSKTSKTVVGLRHNKLHTNALSGSKRGSEIGLLWFHTFMVYDRMMTPLLIFFFLNAFLSIFCTQSSSWFSSLLCPAATFQKCLLSLLLDSASVRAITTAWTCLSYTIHLDTQHAIPELKKITY